MSENFKILFLEDNENDVELIKFQLKKLELNFIYEVTQNQQEFENALHSFIPDLILSDYSLPSFDGLSAFKLVKEKKLKIPFILVTGEISEEFAVSCMKEGMDDYILKGSLHRLPMSIEHILNKYEDQEKIRLADEALSKLKKAVDTSGEVIFMTDLKGIFTYVNPAFTALYGYSSDEIVGKETPRIIKSHLLSKEIYKYFWETLLNKEEIRVEIINKHKDGTILNIDGSATPILDDNNNITGFLGIQRNISERKRAEIELKNAHNYNQLLLDSMAEGAYGVDTEGRCTFVNKSFLNLLGYENASEIIGERTHPLIHHSHADGRNYPNVECKMLNSRKTKQCINVSDEVFWRKNGTPLHVEYWSYPIVQNDKIVGAICTFIDITERKQTEKYQSLSNKLLTLLNSDFSLKEMISSVLESIQRETQYSAVGLRIKKGDDYPYFEQNGFSDSFLLKENSLIARDQNNNICRDANGNIKLECTCGLVISGRTDPSSSLFTKTGSFWTNNSYPLLELSPEEEPRFQPRNTCIHFGYGSVAIIPIKVNNNIIGTLQLNEKKRDAFTANDIQFFEGICLNIGNALMREQANEDIIISEARLKDIIFSMGEWVWEIDENEKYTYSSEKGSEILGIPTDEIIGKTPFDFMATDVVDGVKAKYLELLAKKEAIVDLENWNIGKHGKRICLLTNGVPILDPEGNLKGYRGVDKDITEKVRASENLKEYLQELESKNNQLNDFINIVSHNLRAPLVNITMLVDILEKSKDEDERKEMLGHLNVVSSNLNEIFNELVESLQIKQDIEIKSEKIFLKDCLEKILVGFRPEIKSYKAEIEINFNNAEVINYPPKYIESIFSNFISNALKYKSPVRKPVIKIKTEKVNNNVLLSFNDNGLGIDLVRHKDSLFKIRKIFHKHPDAKGFGLFITKTQVEAMGGKIWAESTPDVGTTFFVEFKDQGHY